MSGKVNGVGEFVYHDMAKQKEDGNFTEQISRNRETRIIFMNGRKITKCSYLNMEELMIWS